MVRSERKKVFAIDGLFNKSLGSYRSPWTITSIVRAGSSESAGLVEEGKEQLLLSSVRGCPGD